MKISEKFPRKFRTFFLLQLNSTMGPDLRTPSPSCKVEEQQLGLSEVEGDVVIVGGGWKSGKLEMVKSSSTVWWVSKNYDQKIDVKTLINYALKFNIDPGFLRFFKIKFQTRSLEAGNLRGGGLGGPRFKKMRSQFQGSTKQKGKGKRIWKK